MNEKRVRQIKDGKADSGPVVYWMSRDQRSKDNYALLFAQKKAIEEKRPLVVVFNLVPTFLGATLRQYDFFLKGLQSVEKNLSDKNIPFYLLKGKPEEIIPEFINKYKVHSLYKDFGPLKIQQTWTKNVLDQVNIPIYEVDTHNIVPCWVASDKQEYAAYTIRPKIHKKLSEFLNEPPPLQKHPHQWEEKPPSIDWKTLYDWIDVDESVKPIDWCEPGEDAALKELDYFIKTKLDTYHKDRNDPTKDGLSELSPYYHFGQLSSQRVAFEVEKAKANQESKDAYLEELIVRKELSDNYCFYCEDYDNPKGFSNWAKTTIEEHKDDEREHLYSIDELENAKTHDELWNAAQMEMNKRGKMHGYMRMYWAKKILEWTTSVEEAQKVAIYLNDKYFLDGRDPNGYVGVAWSVGGVHDRAWPTRKIFGKIRFMNYNGCKNKFNIQAYIDKVNSLEE